MSAGWSIGRNEGLMEALDLPPEVQPLQDAYWHSRRVWQALDDAYKLVLDDMLAQVGFAGVERPAAQGGTASQVPHSPAAASPSPETDER